jgi:predicted DNA-binding transcriptional regulator YafY
MAGRSKVVVIDYTNWRGERRNRRILPERIFFGPTKWHGDPCWHIEAMDKDTNEIRMFALHMIHRWEETK